MSAVGLADNTGEPPAVIHARELYVDATKLADKGKYEDARSLLLGTWAMVKNWQTAAYLATLELKTHRYRESAEHSAFALRALNTKVSGKDMAELEVQYQAAKAHVATVELRGVDGGAPIYVDDQPVGAYPLPDPIFLEPGSHRIEARPVDRPRRGLPVQAEAGKTVALDLSIASALMEPKAAAATLPSTTRNDLALAPSARRPGARTWIAVAGAGATVIAAGVGIGLAVKANADADSAKSLHDRIQNGAGGAWGCGDPMATDCAALQSRYDARDSAASGAKIAFAVAGSVAVATTAVYLLWPTLTRERAPGSEQAWVVPQVGAGFAGLSAGGAF